jgi:hypothetical protein
MKLTTPVVITITNISPIIVDDEAKKTVCMTSKGMLKQLVLWSEAGYDAIGQWTTAQAEARIQEAAKSGELLDCYTLVR